MRLSRFAIAALALSAVACLNPLDAPNGKAGFITLDVLTTGTDMYAVRPLGVFYDETSLHFNRATPGRCAVLPYAETAPQFNVGKTMNVGASVATALPTGTDELLPIDEFDFVFYRSLNAGGIALVPGDTMTFTIPGGDGFPAASIADATPEAFVFADVGVPAESEGIDLSWTAPTALGSIINYSLRYADDFATGTVNRQLSCWFDDDGADSIPSGFLDGWRRAQGDVREVAVTRLRSKVVQVANDIELTLVSTLSVPTPGLTP